MMWTKHSKAGNGSEQQASSSSAAASIRRPSDLSAARPNFCRTPRNLTLFQSQSKEPAAVGAGVLSSFEAAAGRAEDEKFVFESARTQRAGDGSGGAAGRAHVQQLDGQGLKLWNPATYMCIKMLEGHWAAVNCVVLQGGLLCSSSDDHKIKLWDLARFAKRNLSAPDHSVRTLKGHIGTAWNVIQFGDSLFCSCGDNNTVKIWRFR